MQRQGKLRNIILVILERSDAMQVQDKTLLKENNKSENSKLKF